MENRQILIIGLGSMGKRRIRCLLSLGFDKNNIKGFDLNIDRCHETLHTYNIKCYTDIDECMNIHEYNFFIISVPPDYHNIYMNLAIEHKIDFFVEASVLNTNYDTIIDKCFKK